MKKYICTACEWVYDPAVGDPDGGIAPELHLEHHLKIFQMIGYVQFADLGKTHLKK